MFDARNLKVEKPQPKPSVIRAAAAMSSGTMVSRVLGYVRDAVVMAMFSRTVTDAFVVAFRLPNMVRRLLGEGSLSVSFIPVYVDQLANDPTGERAKNLRNATYTLLSSVTLTLTALSWILMEPLLQAWVGDESGFAAVAGKLELTITLARIMCVYVFLVTLFAFFSGIANSIHKFFVPALAPAAFNAVLIAFALMPSEWHPVPGALLSWGVVVAGVIQTGMVAVLLYRVGHLPRWTLKINVAGLRTVITNMGPGLAGLGIFQIMTIANTFFAARLPEGTQTYIYNSDRILELPQSIIAISLGTALLPTFSRQLSTGDRTGMLRTANEGLRTMLFLALPAAVGMYFLAHPMIEVLFGRGQYGPEDIAVTASIVEIYSVLLVVSSLAKVTVPGFYAMKNTWLPAVLAGVSLIVHLALCAWWVDQYGVQGLAGATATSGALNMILLQIAFRYMIGPIGISAVVQAVFRMLPGMFGMGLVIYWMYDFLKPAFSGLGHTLANILALGITIGSGAVVYFLLGKLSGCPEAVRSLALLKRKASSKGIQK